MTATCRVEAPELARVLGNALAFIPARSDIKYARVAFLPDRILTAGTDGYAAGTDWTPVEESEGFSSQGVNTLLHKDGLTIIERFAREAKKTVLLLSLSDGELTLEGDATEGTKTTTVPWFQDEIIDSTYTVLLDLIDRTIKRPVVYPRTLCLDPNWFSKFGKVKADKSTRMADVLLGDGYGPMLVKIGPTFVGLFMPINRDVHGTEVGPDGLWEEA